MASPREPIGGGSVGRSSSDDLSPGRRAVLWCLTALITLGLCLLAAEVSVRVFKRTIALQPDPDLIRWRTPHTDEPISLFETEDNLNGRSFEIPERAIPAGTRPTNNLGMRMAEDVGPKRPGERRVLLLGDSYTEALDVTYDRRFDGIAERILGDRRAEWTRWKIINAGIQNGSPVQYLLMLRWLLPIVEPEIVVVVTGSNDLGDDWTFETTYGFEVDERGIPLRPRHRLGLWLLQKSFFLRYLDYARQELARRIERLTATPNQPPAVQPDWWALSCLGAPEAFRVFEATTGRYLVEIGRMAALEGAKLGVLVIHYSYSFLDEPFYEPRFPGLKQRVIEAGCYEARAQPYIEFIDAFLERNRIPFRDTHAAFLAAKRERPSRKLWNFYDYHFSPAGHVVMGAELADLVSQVRESSETTRAAVPAP